MKNVNSIFLLVFAFLMFFTSDAHSQMNYETKINHIKEDFSIKELENKSWNTSENVVIDKYWSGEDAPTDRHFKAKLLWSDTAIYVRFEANQNEPLITNDVPDLQTKTKNLWDRDVCEIFLAPNKAESRRYFEFEIAPNGEWIDLGIYQKPDERITDWDYDSEMKSAAKIEKDRIVMAIKIEWTAFGAIPKTGDVWLGNIFRCVGAGETRGYLAWSPTFTKEPSFHVPEKFGKFEFAK